MRGHFIAWHARCTGAHAVTMRGSEHPVTPETGATEALDDPKEARYVNSFAVGFNAVEVVLNFAQSYGTGGTSPSVRLVTSPVYAKEFLSMLTAAMGEYENTFGKLQDR